MMAQQEAIFYLEDSRGNLVRVPESRLEQWRRAQEEVRSGAFKTSGQENEQVLSLGRTSRREQTP